LSNWHLNALLEQLQAGDSLDVTMQPVNRVNDWSPVAIAKPVGYRFRGDWHLGQSAHRLLMPAPAGSA
jgi:hypothetical protein